MTCRLCHFTLLHLGLVQKYLYLLYKSTKSIFSENKKNNNPTTKITVGSNMRPFLFLHQWLSIYLCFYPSVLSRPHLQPLSQSISFCLPPMVSLSDSHSTHPSPFSPSFYLIPVHMHCCCGSSLLQGRA